ncbi:MAG: hypothetical protein J1F20_01010 [Muribaculaceae bacterium]|nr:hypothetical protein [Muribaculaceae bacterium]
MKTFYLDYIHTMLSDKLSTHGKKVDVFKKYLVLACHLTFTGYNTIIITHNQNVS